MRQTIQGFRTRYRASIHRHYTPWLHSGFVLVFGVLGIALAWSTLDQLQPQEWLAVPLTLLLFNGGVYLVHRHLGHHKRIATGMFHTRHTSDHHNFFAPGHMTCDSTCDWQIILFPAWLIVLHGLCITLPAWWLLKPLNANVAGLFAASMLLGYLTYEVFHACGHLPHSNAITRLPWIRHMRRLHELHHHRELMQACNFDVVFPLMDYLFGTLYWQAEPDHSDAQSTQRP